MKINLEKVFEMYGRYPRTHIISIYSIYLPNKGSSTIVDGFDFKNSELYYQYGLYFMIEKAISLGASEIQFRMLGSSENIFYPIFAIEELIA